MHKAPIAILLQLLMLMLGGCGLHPAAYPTPVSEMEPRPGVFTGQSGDAVLYRRQ